jgi:hypothetical protein
MAGTTDIDVHFNTLGLTIGASFDDVKQAFRRLARTHHPDKNGGATSATETFKSINAAYFEIVKAFQNEAEGVNKKKQNGDAHDQEDDHEFSCFGGQVTENQGSITVNFPHDLFEDWSQVLHELYGVPQDLGPHGLKFSSHITIEDETDSSASTTGSVHITLYQSTSRLHIQGSMYMIWLMDHFQALCKKVRKVKVPTESEVAPAVCPNSQRTGRPTTRTVTGNIPRSRRSHSGKETNNSTKKSTSSCPGCKNPDNKDMIMCGPCQNWWHYTCTDIPVGELQFHITNRDSKYSCINCTSVTSEMVKLRKDILGAINRLESHVVSSMETNLRDTEDKSREQLNTELKCATEQRHLQSKLLQKSEKECKDLRTALTQAEAENARLMSLPSQSLALEQQVQKLQMERSSMSDNIRLLNTDLTSSRAECSELRKQKQSLLEETTTLRSRVSAAEISVSKLDSELSRLRDEIQSSQADSNTVAETVVGQPAPTKMSQGDNSLLSGASIINPNPFSVLSHEYTTAESDEDEPASRTDTPQPKATAATNFPNVKQGGHLVVTSSLGRSLDPNRLLFDDNSDRVFVKSMPGGRIEDAHNLLKSDRFSNLSVTVMIGTNNISRGESVEECLSKYQSMLDTVMATQPSADINILELPKRDDNPALNSVITEFNLRLQRLCSTNARLHFVNFQIEPSDLVDGLHLNRTGNHKLVTAIRTALIPGYSPRPRPRAPHPYYSQNMPSFHGDRGQYQEDLPRPPRRSDSGLPRPREEPQNMPNFHGDRGQYQEDLPRPPRRSDSGLPRPREEPENPWFRQHAPNHKHAPNTQPQESMGDLLSRALLKFLGP